MIAPTFVWRDTTPAAQVWTIEAAGLRVRALAERLRIGEVDPRAGVPTNEWPKLTSGQVAARIWTPDAAT